MELGWGGVYRMTTAASQNVQKNDNLMEAQIIFVLVTCEEERERRDKVELGVAIVCASSSVGLPAHLPLN